jgi:hypothetical protein
MIVFASTPRFTRRPRRIPSVASLVRALGTVRITDQPVERVTSSGSAHLHTDVDNQARTSLQLVGSPPRSS